VHPNEEVSVVTANHKPSHLLPDGPAEPGSFATSAFVKWFIEFDETNLRPFFIRNYNATKANLEDELFELQNQNLDNDSIHEIAEKVEKMTERKRSIFIENDMGYRKRVQSSAGAYDRQALLDGRRYHGDTAAFPGTLNAMSA